MRPENNKNQKKGHEMKNNQKIRLLENLTTLQIRLTMLRTAKMAGDAETVNMTVLGRLNDQRIKYEKID